MIWSVSVVFVFLPIIGLGLERGERCTNHWGEKATCTTIYSCKAAIDAIAAANGSRLYAAGRVCGFDTEALVCCRTVADFDETSINNIVPTTESVTTDVNISNNSSSFNESFVLELPNNNIPLDDTTPNINSSPEITVALDERIRPNKRQTVGSSTPSSSDEAIFTSPLVVLPIDKTSTFPATIPTTTTSEPPTTTQAVDPLPLQSNDTSEASVLSDFSSFTDESSSSTFPEIIPETTPTTSRSFVTRPSVLTTQVYVDQVLPDRYACGFQHRRNRIADAPISTIDEFPWTVLLRYQDSFGYDVGFKCVGTLVNNRYVVTSAHCVVSGPERLKLKSVRLGEWSISSHSDCIFENKRQECPDKVIDVAIDKIIPHPNSNNNIALIRMERKVAFTDFVRAICLPVDQLEAPSVGTTLITSGWGASKSGCLLDIKSKIRLITLPKQKCTNNPFWYMRVLEDQICVDAFTRNDICKTDSGGPLMRLDNYDKPQWYLEGVIPEGFFCDNRGFLGLYTRITNYIPWIIFTLGQEGD